MNTEIIRIERPTTNSRLFAHTRWDAIPALAGLSHLAYFVGLFFLYPHASLWVMLLLGFIYSLMVNANINGVGHNFIHNPSPAASRKRCTTLCTCNITRGIPIARMKTGILQIGCQFIVMATTARRKIHGLMCS